MKSDNLKANQTSRIRSTAAVLAAATAIGFTILGFSPAADASPENGCNGLYDVARFETFKNGRDTNGHDTVHHQFEEHGCAHHDHP